MGKRPKVTLPKFFLRKLTLSSAAKDHQTVIATAAKILSHAANSLTLSPGERAGVRGKSLLDSPAHKFLHKF
jgi:hypothetical protein